MYGKSALHALGVLIVCAQGYLTSCAVRVLIAEGDCATDRFCLVPEGQSWTVGVPERPQVAVHTFTTDEGNVSICPSGIRINGKRVQVPAVYLKAQGGSWMYEGNRYPGDMILMVKDGRWMLINRLDLETYVWGVVRWESWPGWPLEMNKVCAVLARTYAINKIMHAQNRAKKGKPSAYDVRATNADQTYKGAHGYMHLWDAVRDTAHLVLTHQGKPIMAMYDACCGGVVPADIQGFNFDEYPYLARTYACTHCASSKAFSWSITYDKKLLRKLLQEYIPDLKDIIDLSDGVYDKGGKLLRVLVYDATGAHVLSGAQLYHACKDIKSFCYQISTHKNTVRIRGKGWGHHMGLCQWGARALVTQGMSARRIMDYYYPGTMLMRLSSKDEHAVL